jgi:hypothetical protein
MNVQATCENCKCTGKLYKRNQSREVILIPTVTVNVGIEAEDPKRNEKGFLAPHGFATALQRINFLVWGTLFWVTVMLVANYVSFEKNRFKAGVGSRVEISAKIGFRRLPDLRSAICQIYPILQTKFSSSADRISDY